LDAVEHGQDDDRTDQTQGHTVDGLLEAGEAAGLLLEPSRSRAGQTEADQRGDPEEKHELPELCGGPDPPHLHGVEERGGEDEAPADGAQNVLKLFPPGSLLAFQPTPVHFPACLFRITPALMRNHRHSIIQLRPTHKRTLRQDTLARQRDDKDES
jgi:hypothetical protein